MRAVWLTLLAIVGAVFLSQPASAQESAQAAESAFLSEMFGGTPLVAERFTPDVLAQVPLAQLQAVVDQLRGVIGPVVMVRALGGAEYVVVTATHELPATIVLDPNNRIAGLFFRPPVPNNLPVADAIAGLGPDPAYLVIRDGEVLFERRADEALAVGSAFKLGILAVLNDAVKAGTKSWSDVVTLEERHRSLPTGILQGWPAGSPLTLQTAASLMISISDNTATDLLLEIAGRDDVARKLAINTVLSTRELFILKADARLRAMYTGGNVEQALAEAAKAPLPEINQIADHHPGVEWYVPLRRLCALVAEVAGLDVFKINPGVADPADWTDIAFKGGSEIGVLNMTTQVTNAAGQTYCAAATWNAASGPVSEATAIPAYALLLKALAKNP